MFSPNVRLVLIVACVAAAALSAGDDARMAAALAAMAALLGYGYVRMGGVPGAFVALHRGDLGRAKVLLGQTRTGALNAESRAKYAWVEAALAEAAGDLEGAREKMEAALADESIANKRVRAIGYCTLAAIEGRLGHPDAAREALARAEATSEHPDARRAIEKTRAAL